MRDRVRPSVNVEVRMDRTRVRREETSCTGSWGRRARRSEGAEEEEEEKEKDDLRLKSLCRGVVLLGREYTLERRMKRVILLWKGVLPTRKKNQDRQTLFVVFFSFLVLLQLLPLPMSDSEKSRKKVKSEGEPRYAISVIAKPLANKKLTKKIFKLTGKGL